MTDSDLLDPSSRDRGKLGKLIRRRPRVGTASALIMSLVFALVASAVIMSDSLLISAGVVNFETGKEAPVTLRVAQLDGTRSGAHDLQGGPIVIERGEPLTPESERLARAVIDTMPSGISAFGAFFAVFFLLGILYTTQVRRSHRGRLLRTQAVTLLLLLGGAVVFKVALLVSPLSVFIVPVAGAAMVATLVVDVSVGLATGLIVSVLIGLLVPFDLGVMAILCVQACTAVLVLGEKKNKNRHVILAGLVSAVASVSAYVVLYYLYTQDSPLYDLSDPMRSTVSAAAAGGLLSAIVAIIAQPIYQFLLGDITRNKLVELEDLSNPLLKRIAENSPGTWQHSLAMANMAEVATNAIGGNGRLVRVGAYYHDLGKSLQPKYFIENLEHGEPSPHDRLAPEVSCDAIHAHVTEGVRLGRKSGLPERIIDFMHMHHGDGLLQYFWSKCQESGNPKGLTKEDFRYPGLPPQSRETAILAIVDAVEAASRTLKSPDDKSISNLVQRIVYGKLHLGQLDESGLSMADLRKISNSLRESIKHGHHGRIEYPWQRQEREARAAAEAARKLQGSETGEQLAAGKRPVPVQPGASTQKIINEPRLDSLDVPRPYWRTSSSSARQSSDLSDGALGVAATERAPLREPEPPPRPAPAVVAEPVVEPAVAPTVQPAVQRPAPVAAHAVEAPSERSAYVHDAPGMAAGPRPSDPPWAAAFKTGQHASASPPVAAEPAQALVLPKKKKKPQIIAHADPILDTAATTQLAALTAPPGGASRSPAELNETAPLTAIPPKPPNRPGDAAARVLARAKAEAQAASRAPEASSTAHKRTLVATAKDVIRPTSLSAGQLSEFTFDDEPTSVASGLSRSDARLPPPPPGSKERKQGSTIELMKERPATPVPVAEAAIEDEELVPGTLVLGPPPATRPKSDRASREPVVAPVTIRPKKKRS